MPQNKVYRSTLEGSLEELPRKVVGMRKCLHVFLFLFLFGNDVADFISDWLFFADVVSAEKGLVYGPPDPAAVWCLLLFSIIGTCTFCFECANLWWEFFRNNPWMDSDWLSAIVIWIEDVPQVLISLYLALCREEPISIFQLSKAAVILIGVVIRIIVTSVKYCNKKAIRSHHHVKIKAVIMLGIIIEAMSAGAIFFLTQTERGYSGDVAFRVPSTVIEDTYNDQRYFQDVSIYFNNKAVFDAGMLDPNKTDLIVNWISLGSVYSIIRGNDTKSVKIDHEDIGNNIINLAISEKQRDDDRWILTECYSINTSSAAIRALNSTICSQPAFFRNSNSIFIKLQYEKPGPIFKKKVFGDIHINIKTLENNICKTVSDYGDSVESRLPLVFHYYQGNTTMQRPDTKHLLYQSGIPRFFQNKDSEMADVSLRWNTGWMECACNGNVAPYFDQDLELKCT